MRDGSGGTDIDYPGWPSFTREEADAIGSVLLSNKVNYWTGEEGRKFEKEFADLVGCQYAVALTNGTVALEQALLALGIGPGDEIVVTPRTFIASASCIVNIGAKPVFADVDPVSQNIDAETISAALTANTRAVICVHLAGWPCDMDAILDLAEERGLWVIEDCAQAHGALYKGQSVGSFGHAAAWSFCQDKIMTTGGEGGMLTTNNAAIWEKVWSYKDHGKSWKAVNQLHESPGFRWLHESFGSNLRLTEMQAAIGRIQIKKLPAWHQARTRNASMIMRACSEYSDGLRMENPPESVEHAWYRCYAFVEPDGLAPGWSRDRIVSEVNRRGIPCYTGSCPEVYLEQAFVKAGLQPPARLPVAQKLGESSLAFLVHPTLTDDAIEFTCRVIRAVMVQALP